MNRIKELREEKNLSQEAVAKAIGTSQTNIGRWEKCQNEPTSSFLVKLADFFSCSIDYLLGIEDDFGIIHSGNDWSKLRPDEERLLANFNNLIPPMQNYVLDMVEALTAQPQNKKKANL